MLIYAVKQVVESQPLNAGFATPDWIEHVEMQYEVNNFLIFIEWKAKDTPVVGFILFTMTCVVCGSASAQHASASFLTRLRVRHPM